MISLPKSYTEKRTKIRILELAVENGLKEIDFKKRLLQSGIEGTFDVKRWPDYVKIISGNEPCRICGGMTKYSQRHNGNACIEYPAHFYVLRFTPIMLDVPNPEFPSAFIGAGIALGKFNPEYAQALLLGQVCRHDLFLVDCKVCYAELTQAKIAAND